MLVVIADNMEESVVKAISELGQVRNRPEDVKAAIADADALVVRSATKVTRELIADSKLKLVIRAGVGTDNIEKEACKELGIKVMNTPGASSNAVAELVLGLAICGLRNVQKAHHQMKNRQWEKKRLTGNEVGGKILGIIGYGRIGGLLGKKANSLGMEVVASDPHPREDGIAKFMSNDEVFAKADVITLHVPALPGTINLINKENISKMKDGAFIINTSRGEIVDEDALYDACKSGKLKGAALDVYREEPYKGKLLELDNVYLTPHLGAATKEAQTRIGEEVIEVLKRELA